MDCWCWSEVWRVDLMMRGRREDSKKEEGLAYYW
jgi:hypothetical protein